MSATLTPDRAAQHRTLLAALLATVAMLFTALAAAYLERRSANAAWDRIDLPGVLVASTALLLLSSVAAEWARRTHARGALALTVLLGAGFLGGQLLAWSELRAAGVFLPTSAYASFFYLLTAVHGVHLLAAMLALLAALRRPAILGLCVMFWHFMGGVWIYALLVLNLL